jgi:hypothetical protein
MSVTSVMSAARNIDAFLAATYGLHLEDLLCEGCLVGRLGPTVAERVKLIPRLVQSTSEDDGGVAQIYEGLMALDGLWHRFRCQIFIDSGGERFLADVTAFEPLGWETRVAIPA